MVVIGGGWIGLETAAAARAAGAEVTVLEAAELPLLRVLGPEVAQVFADLHTEQGVDLRVRRAGGRDHRHRRARATGSGSPTAATSRPTRSSPGSASRPTPGWPRRPGLTVDNGIQVDAQLRTSRPGHLRGRAMSPTRSTRCSARTSGSSTGPTRCTSRQVAAKAMLGQDASYDRLPYFFTDQYDLGMEYSGYVPPGGHDEVVLPRRPWPGGSSSRSGCAAAGYWPG